MASPDQNKANVKAFYDLAFNQRQPEEAVKQSVGSSYRQHNPMAGDGPEPFIGFVKWITGENPDPAEGTANDVSNPPRVAPRYLLHLGIGADNLLHTDRTKLRLRFSIINLTNKDALYEFLSTFSGTHFVTLRAFQLQVGVIS